MMDGTNTKVVLTTGYSSLLWWDDNMTNVTIVIRKGT